MIVLEIDIRVICGAEIQNQLQLFGLRASLREVAEMDGTIKTL